MMQDVRHFDNCKTYVKYYHTTKFLLLSLLSQLSFSSYNGIYVFTFPPSLHYTKAEKIPRLSVFNNDRDNVAFNKYV